MSLNLTVLNRYSMESFRTNEPYIVISIRCPNDSLPKFAFDSNRKDVLYIEINDTDDKKLAEKYDYKMLSEEEAEQILEFVFHHKDNIPNVVVHCDAGKSRSAGTAAALLKIFNGDDSSIMENRRFIPNMYIYRLLLNKAFDKGIYKP